MYPNGIVRSADFPIKVDQTDKGARRWWPDKGPAIVFPLLPLDFAREEARKAKRRELSALLQELQQQPPCNHCAHL
jgi:hypothetical protein